ncbi:hypothetical protein OB905_03755 [Halobacteria archaeon AArc-dxtr1]|nr:hypothetical protein [Halobacteria archaeon AArc-dxtr1]
MLRWEGGDGVITVVDADSTEITIEGPDLVAGGSGAAIDRPVDETINAVTRTLRVPRAVVYAFAADGRRYELDPVDGSLSLPPAQYVVDVDAAVKIYLQFSGAATISHTEDGRSVRISFPNRRDVAIGLRSHYELPTETITVTESPADVAAAIGHLHAAVETETPNRTYPTKRGHPPLLELGDEFEIPESVRDETATTGIELVVPPTYEALYCTAPLAYFLQASVRLGATGPPRIRLRDEGITARFDRRLEESAARLLRKVFFLDCLVRNEGPHDAPLSELSILRALDLDSETLYRAEPQTRLASYLEVPDAAIEHRLPDWHLATYVKPEPSRLATLPFLLDRMSLIYMPRTSTLEGRELIDRSLDAFYRAPARTGRSRNAPSVDVVKPELRTGRVHGWLADGVPIDVFTSHPAAYRNRFTYLERADESTSICVVLNDPAMTGERVSVTDIYRQRAKSIRIDLSVTESLTTAQLARVFESGHDFVHYIGHCETGGLQCADGTLSATSLDRCSTQTFFLNACGSYYEGMELIERGSVAGAVTVNEVLNEHALKVGSTFAKLLVHGFSFERALRLARRRIMMGKDYAVVGDGTHSLTQRQSTFPVSVSVEPTDDGRYLLTFDCYSPRTAGSYYVPHDQQDEYAYLCGTAASILLEESELREFLAESAVAVIYDGDVHWSRELSGLFTG